MDLLDRTRKGVAFAVVSTCFVLFTVSAASGQAPPTVTLVRNPTQGGPGTVIAVSGTGCIFMESAHVVIGTDPQAFVRTAVQSDGSWSAEIVVPATQTPGTVLLASDCGAADFTPTWTVLQSDFTVTDRPAATAVVNPAAVDPGATITVTGTGCSTAAGVLATATPMLITPPGPNASGLKAVTTGAPVAVTGAGDYAATLTVPSDAAGGPYLVHVRCDGASASIVSLDASVTVVGPPDTTTTTTEPSTTDTSTLRINPVKPVVVTPTFTG